MLVKAATDGPIANRYNGHTLEYTVWITNKMIEVTKQQFEITFASMAENIS